jgi:hypothetical protein
VGRAGRAGEIRFRLKTLTVIEKAWDLIGRDQIDIPAARRQETFERWRATDRVFQLEATACATSCAAEARPLRGHRRGGALPPRPDGKHPSYIKRKHGEDTPTTCIRCSKGS